MYIAFVVHSIENIEKTSYNDALCVGYNCYSPREQTVTSFRIEQTYISYEFYITEANLDFFDDKSL